ncbi:MAG: restriction endonuclease [Xanthomonadales bacterium]|nr:restriction endonuclease [Xanthomonadales bacterium]|tara:strand:- start:2604 stop:3329 length:726 start_codon:yes stop_codon:yes gene_type:complete
MFERLTENGFEIVTLHHAEAILSQDMPEAVTELDSVLANITLPIEEIIRGGGGEGKLTQRIRRALAEFGWIKHNFEIKKTVDGVEKESLSHEIDHVKKFGDWTFALEIEWNNKDPFFDRDLENFKRLHADGVISVGAIVTRGSSLQGALREYVAKFSRDSGFSGIENLGEYYSPTERQTKNIQRAIESAGDFHTGWANAFVADKFGEATTHWRKLEDRVHRGVGNPCPLLLIGIPAQIVTF